MSDEIEKRLVAIAGQDPHDVIADDVTWLLATVRGQMARAEKAEEHLAACRAELRIDARRAEKSEKSCAALRAALFETTKAWHLAAHQGDGFDDTEAEIFDRAKLALDTDAGRDWVPRAELEQTQAALAELVEESLVREHATLEERDKLRAEVEAAKIYDPDIWGAATQVERDRCVEIVREEGRENFMNPGFAHTGHLARRILEGK